jgi:hypothetical protein
MKRLLQLCVCAGLVFTLVGCNFALLWSGITGSGYYSVTRSTISNVSGNLSINSIDLSTLTTSSVIVYETPSPNFYYGKLALTALAASSGITVQFVTYNSDGTANKTSNGTSVAAGQYLDLETNTLSSGSSTACFQYSSSMTLVPANGAKFYIYSK